MYKGGKDMSRKQKRQIRKERRKQMMQNNKKCDRHHILYQRTNWSRGALCILRQYNYCKVYIPRDLHEKIHEAVGNITPPSITNAIQALKMIKNLEMYDSIGEFDDLEKRIKVLIFVFDSVEPKTVECLKRQLEIVHDYYEPS
jgi:hypothetical protein